jgi:hypothetical protein
MPDGRFIDLSQIERTLSSADAQDIGQTLMEPERL